MAIAVSRSSRTNLELPKDHQLPGHSVDALLAAGDLVAARAELERLIEMAASEDDGSLTEITPEYWKNMRIRAGERASRKA